jgi:hypothetical protein
MKPYEHDVFRRAVLEAVDDASRCANDIAYQVEYILFIAKGKPIILDLAWRQAFMRKVRRCLRWGVKQGLVVKDPPRSTEDRTMGGRHLHTWHRKPEPQGEE